MGLNMVIVLQRTNKQFLNTKVLVSSSSMFPKNLDLTLAASSPSVFGRRPVKRRSEFSRFSLRLFLSRSVHLVGKKKDAIDASESLFSDSDQDRDPLPSKRPRKAPTSAEANEWSLAEGEKGY